MLSRTLFAAALALTAPTAPAAEALPLEGQLPQWAREKWNTVSKARGLKLTPRVNPFLWRGDFDADGRHDLAVLVQHARTGKEGVAILLRSNVPAIVVGAGNNFGNGGDDFGWMDMWAVEERRASQRRSGDRPARTGGDALMVAKEGSASALIYIVNGKPRWQQQGD